MTLERNDIGFQEAVRDRDTVADRTGERQEKEKASWRRPVIGNLGLLVDTEGTHFAAEREFNVLHYDRNTGPIS